MKLFERDKSSHPCLHLREAVTLTPLAWSSDSKSDFSGVQKGGHQSGFSPATHLLWQWERKRRSEYRWVGGIQGWLMACSLCPNCSLWKSQTLASWPLALELTVTMETALLYLDQRPRGSQSLEYMVWMMVSLQWRAPGKSTLTSTQVRVSDLLVSLFHGYVLLVHGWWPNRRNKGVSYI